MKGARANGGVPASRPLARRGWILGAFALLIAAIGVAWNYPKAKTATVPLPELPNGPIALRVAYVVNPRLPRFTDAQLDALLAAARHGAREHLDVDLEFALPIQVPIALLFERIPEAVRRQALAQVYDFGADGADASRLAQAFARGFSSSGQTLPELVQAARAAGVTIDADTFEAFGAAAARVELERSQKWRNLKALDGGPLIDASGYNEFAMWIALGYVDLPYDLVLTNQPIDSVEYGWPAISAVVRGGYSNGVTTYNRSGRFLAMSVWSTFAFSSNEPWVVDMRGGESYEAGEAARLSGLGAVHELGHQLFHYGHPYGNPACVMNPVPLLAYRRWAAALSAQRCIKGGSPAMTPGAVTLAYDDGS
jgi:hypothetical protein